MAAVRPVVVIPNLNGGERLMTALSSLRGQTLSVDVVIVDNASSDRSAARARDAFEGVRVLELPTNVGYGRAINLGVRECRGNPLVFLNNDVECRPDFAEALVEACDSRTAAVAGVLLRPHGARIDSAGVVVDPSLHAFDHLHGEPEAAAQDASAPLGPTGAAALYRRDVFERLGGFDERIFAYLEDVDLALRLRASGERCRLAPGAQALHHHSSTLGHGSPAKDALVGFSRGYLLRRYGVLRRPPLALRTVAEETATCLGEVALDRTVAGVAGRLRGWQAARGLPRRPIPDDATLPLTLRQSLVRMTRRPRD